MKTTPNKSHWEANTFLATADVIIVGAGIVGVNAAIDIQEARPNWRVLVVERGVLPSGASTKNAGFACVGSISELADDLEQNSFESVSQLILQRWKGLKLLRKRVGDANMDYQNSNGYELFDQESIDTYAPLMSKFNQHFRNEFPKGLYHMYPSKLKEASTSAFSHCIVNPYEGALHPGKMMQNLLRKAREIGVEVLFGCEVIGWEETQESVLVDTSEGKLRGAQLLISTNGFSKKLLPRLDIKPARNQVLITEPILDLPWIGTYHFDKGFIYFRNVGKRLLLGGARNTNLTAETTSEFGLTESIQETLLEFLNKKLFPNRTIQIERWWSGIMGLGPVKSPILKRTSERVILAIRLGGMGIALGSLVAEEAAKLIIEA